MVAALMLWYGYAPTTSLLLLPVFVVLALGVALAYRTVDVCLTVQYRDVQYLLPFPHASPAAGVASGVFS